LPRSLPRYIERDTEIARVLVTAGTSDPAGRRPWPERDLALAAVLVGTGARASEVCGVRIRDLVLDVEDPYIRVTGKGRAVRDCPLPPEVDTAVQTYLKPTGAHALESAARRPGVAEQPRAAAHSRCARPPGPPLVRPRRRAPPSRGGCTRLPAHRGDAAGRSRRCSQRRAGVARARIPELDADLHPRCGPPRPRGRPRAAGPRNLAADAIEKTSSVVRRRSFTQDTLISRSWENIGAHEPTQRRSTPGCLGGRLLERTVMDAGKGRDETQPLTPPVSLPNG
jgi:Phage integrase family